MIIFDDLLKFIYERTHRKSFTGEKSSDSFQDVKYCNTNLVGIIPI